MRLCHQVSEWRSWRRGIIGSPKASAMNEVDLERARATPAQLFAGSFQKKIVSSRACFAIAESRACRFLCVSRLPGRISFHGTGGCRHARPACHGRYMLCQTRTLTPRASSMDRCMFPCAPANECNQLAFETLSETAKFCSKCGKAQLNPEIKFCGGCGNGF